MARVANEEDKHQIAIAQWLAYKAPDMCWFHPANEGLRSPAMGAWLKKKGMRPGVSDFIFLQAANGYHFLVIELKATKAKKPTAYQLEFIAHVKRAGGWGEVCYGSDETIKFIEKFYGL